MVSKLKHILIIVLFLTIQSCSKNKIEISNLNGNKVSVIGHAGAGFQSYSNPVPENSIESARKAVESYNAEGIELDVQMSADGELFLFHDEFLSLNTNLDGCIYLYNSTDLNTCKYKNTNIKIARLEEVLELFSGRNPKPLIFLDLRSSACPLDYENFKSKVSNSIVGLIEKYNGWDWIFVEYPGANLLNHLRVLDKRVNLIYETENSDSIKYAAENKYFGIVCSNKISAQTIETAHNIGLRVSIFDAPSKKGAKEAIKKNPDYIQTDNIILLQQLLR